MRIYNSLTRKIETVEPIKKGKFGVYTCGPTVYDYLSIGNWRTYVLGDLIVRVLGWLDYEVDYIMNITDVGHLTGDNVGDADTGEDRMEKGAKREGKTAWDIAKFYTDDFLKSFDKLNLVKPKKFTKATEYIKEQIELVEKIEKKGLSYKAGDGIYFNVQAYEKTGNKYGELSTLDKIKEGARVKTKIKKKDPRDFALWKFSPKDEKRQMEWQSPWGRGFPGWHVECSAMSMNHLGEQFDIHVGGEDLKSIHHPNEIAQSQAATGKKPFVRYWIHGAFLQVDGGRMGKSLGNAYRVQDIEKKGFTVMDLRYFYLTGHYRKPLNFTWKALGSAKETNNKLRSIAAEWQGVKTRTKLSEEKLQQVQEFSSKFKAAVENDLAMPEAIAVMWQMVKSNIPEQDKWELISDWDQVLGLGLSQIKKEKLVIPTEVKELVDKREKLRQEKKWPEADKVRQGIEAKGFVVLDTAQGSKVKEKSRGND